MPIVFTHFLSGLAAVGVLALVYRKKLSTPLFYLWGIFTFTLPDLDHLAYWKPCMTEWIVPLTLNDLVKGMFIPRPPFLLHNWLFPLGFLASYLPLAVILAVTRSKIKGWEKYLAILILGWGVHLFMDGVTLL